jgi:endonuclease/exonuclease/phosphatase family metal-dependent hydrolase
MPRIDGLLSWNMGFNSLEPTDVAIRARRLALLRELVDDRDVALLALQEAPSKYELQRELGSSFAIETTTGGVAIGYRASRWSADYCDASHPRTAVLGLQPVGASESIWMFSVHGPALHVTDRDKQEFVRGVGRTLRARRAVDGSRLNIIAGDLNLPPFDPSITRKEGLYANRALRWVRNHAAGVDAPLFNPTWILLGRCDDVPGTFYRSSVDGDGPWHGCDQVLLSGEFAQAGFDIAVVDSVGTIRLRTNGQIGAPDKKVGSDHLPIAAQLAVG